MCTAVAISKGDSFFGRTLDLEYHYHESVVITPRSYRLQAPAGDLVVGKYALIGMATVEEGYPLYYDAMNECGLCMAGLHFPENAVYLPPDKDWINVTPYALIPKVLSACATLNEAKTLLSGVRLTNQHFSHQYPLSPLHWIVAKNGQTLVVEPTRDGLKIYENPTGVLTNNPDFPAHLAEAAHYIGLSPKEPQERLLDASLLPPRSRGLGALGMPGDYSSPSRFIRALFLRQNSPSLSGAAGVIQFFRLMDAVIVPRGAVESEDGRLVHTVYTSCCNPQELAYYYNNYENPSIIGVHLGAAEKNSDCLQCYPMRTESTIRWEN